MNPRTSRLTQTGKVGAYSHRTGRAPALALLERHFAFASTVARLAELAGVAVSVFWTVDELFDAPPWPWDVLIVDERELSALEARMAHSPERFAKTTVMVMNDAEREQGAHLVLRQAMARMGRGEGAWADRFAVVDAQGDYGRAIGVAAHRRGLDIDYFLNLDQLARDQRLNTYSAILLRSDWRDGGLGAAAALVGASHGIPVLVVSERLTLELPSSAGDVRVFHDVADVEGALAMTLTLAKRRFMGGEASTADQAHH